MIDMRFMNEYDIQHALEIHMNDPLLAPATRTLYNLMTWTNRNSDGWPYWSKPVRAAEKLMALIESQSRYVSNPDDITADDVRAAYRPIKSFRTRHGADFTIVEAL